MDTVALLDELRTLAKNGLAHSTDPYDRERYRRVLDLTANEYADLADLPTEAVRERFAAELGHVTPKAGADATEKLRPVLSMHTALTNQSPWITRWLRLVDTLTRNFVDTATCQ